MTPLELCEPLFQYVCRVNRSARKNGLYTHDQVQAEVRALLDDIPQRARADPDPALAEQFDPERGQLSLALTYFVDFMMRNSSLSFASEWSDIAAADGLGDGDRKFWELLDKTVAARGAPATQRLAVYYTCIGLGFTGAHTDDPVYLRTKMLELQPRLRGMVSADGDRPICPEAYEHVNTDNLVAPPRNSLVGVAIGLIGMAIVLFVANACVFRQSKGDIESHVTGIISDEARLTRDASAGRPPTPPTTAPTAGAATQASR